MSIASEITRINNNIASAYTKVSTKGGTLPATQNSANLPNAIDTIPTGLTPTGNINITDTNVTDVTNYATAQVVDADLVASNIKKDVNILGVVGTYELPSPQMDDVDNGGVVFINYNGDVLYKYNTANMQALSSLPALPNNQGFKEETWNWTLTEIKTHLTSYPGSTLTVGVNLVPTDDKTHVFYEVKEDTKTIYLTLGISGSVTIEWGDGTTSTATGSYISQNVFTPHTYSSTGTYEIKFAVNGSARIVGGSAPILINNANNTSNADEGVYFSKGVKKLYIGKNVDLMGYSLGFKSVEEISIPNNLDCAIQYILYYNQACKGLVIPKPTNMFRGMNLVFGSVIEYLSLPPTITSLEAGSMLSAIYHLNYITFTGVTTLPATFLTNMSSMKNICFPSGVTTIPNNTCNYATSLKKLKFPSSITSIGTSTFTNLYSCKIIDLSNLTSVTALLNSSFTSIATCEEIKLPPNLQTIGTSCFSQAFYVRKIKFPTTLTSIGNFAFQSPKGLILADFRGFTSIPSLGGTSAFQGSNANLKIIVPDSLYATWRTTTNWTGLASKIVKESDYSD